VERLEAAREREAPRGKPSRDRRSEPFCFRNWRRVNLATRRFRPCVLIETEPAPPPGAGSYFEVRASARWDRTVGGSIAPGTEAPPGRRGSVAARALRFGPAAVWMERKPVSLFAGFCPSNLN
jgi:hypothetical protein